MGLQDKWSVKGRWRELVPRVMLSAWLADLHGSQGSIQLCQRYLRVPFRAKVKDGLLLADSDKAGMEQQDHKLWHLGGVRTQRRVGKGEESDFISQKLWPCS